MSHSHTPSMSEIMKCACQREHHTEACMKRLVEGMTALIVADKLLGKGLTLILKTISELPKDLSVREASADLGNKIEMMIERNTMVALGTIYDCHDFGTKEMLHDS